MEKFKVVGLRFIRAFVSGALASGSAIVGMIYVQTHSWVDFAQATNVLALAVVVGGITGVFQAGDKLIRWEE